MGIFQQFPYTNFHEMNLDQIIKIMREMQDEWEATKTEWASYKDFIDNYFANLDLDEETEKALLKFITDGTLSPVIDPVIVSATTDWLVAHITQPTTPAIDTSLSIAGAAADSKAAGDAISAVETIAENNAQQIESNNAYDIIYKYLATKVVSMISAGITFTDNNDGTWSFSGTATSTAFIRFFSDASAFPDGVEPGKTYYVKHHADKIGFQIAAYFNNSSGNYSWIYSSLEDGVVHIPDNATGLMVRNNIVAGVTVNETIEIPKLLTGESNATLSEQIRNIQHSGTVTLIKDDMYYVRSGYDDARDSVCTFKYPDTTYAYTFNFNDIRLIPADTPVSGTIAAYNASTMYKDMHDDIPAFIINNVILGSNHGNPNFIRSNCTHSVPQSDIGTVWTDEQGYTYTLVQVFPTFLVFGSLDGSGNLVTRDPAQVTHGGVTITITNNTPQQLRRAALDRTIEIVNNDGNDCYNGGAGADIRVYETYEILDQAKMVLWLQANTGNLTNASCYSDLIPYRLAKVENIFIFNPNSTLTIYGTLTALDNFTLNNLYGGISLDFKSGGAGTDYGYVPQSNDFATPTVIDYSTNMYIHPSNETPYRFYQMTTTGDGKGAFLHLIDDLGDCDADIRKTLNPFAWFAGDTTDKLYLQVLQNFAMVTGKKVSWGYGKGIYKKVSGQTVNTAFKLGNAWIVSVDVPAAFNGYVTLPDDIAGRKITITDKTNNVTVNSEYVSNTGIKITSTGSGYVVMTISA